MKHDRTKAINLFKTAKGQIEATIRMAEDNRYCVDVANQVEATSALLKKANLLILQDHINTCVKASFEDGTSEEKIEEIMKLIQKYM
ncbi:metal-sensing transcriptional repressor [Mycoplasmatota bacterium]|nr:metal-sensing transcriptional repressor [Mycoplasmatota bacterium]